MLRPVPLLHAIRKRAAQDLLDEVGPRMRQPFHRHAHDIAIEARRPLGEEDRGATGRHSRQHHIPIRAQALGGASERHAVLRNRQQHQLPVVLELGRGQVEQEPVQLHRADHEAAVGKELLGHSTQKLAAGLLGQVADAGVLRQHLHGALQHQALAHSGRHALKASAASPGHSTLLLLPGLLREAEQLGHAPHGLEHHFRIALQGRGGAAEGAGVLAHRLQHHLLVMLPHGWQHGERHAKLAYQLQRTLAGRAPRRPFGWGLGIRHGT
mmetsp:Transcript_4956/g.19835  ORF Transcript_4956/g.19835 Transcript_4956/m.19835 type:complete len:268 (+) Transcript_4956:216-1019(+)